MSFEASAPTSVLGVTVARVLDVWFVDDMHGSRRYCKVATGDGREVTLLQTDSGWHPTIVTGAAA